MLAVYTQCTQKMIDPAREYNFLNGDESIMDGLQGIGANGNYIEYKGHTFLKITDQLTRNEATLDIDKASVHIPTPQENKQAWRPYYTSGSLLKSPVVSDVYREVDASMDDAVNRYLDGDLTDGQLTDTIHSLLTRLCDACNERGYPTPLGGGIYGEQAMADNFYSEFRTKLLNEAISRNNAEGVQYAANGKNGNWQYYNSDYYYKTESAMAAAKSGVMNFCQEKGYSDFTFTNRKDEWKLEVVGFNYYDDFNSAWSNSFKSPQTFINEDQAPPKDFVWFYETGGSEKICFVGDRKADAAVFDPENPLSARMWISYKDSNGDIKRSSTTFAYDRSKDDLKSIAALLNVLGGDAALNRFLQNIQVFSKGHFQRYPLSNVDIRA